MLEEPNHLTVGPKHQRYLVSARRVSRVVFADEGCDRAPGQKGVAGLVFHGEDLGSERGIVASTDGEVTGTGQDAECAGQPRHAEVVRRVPGGAP